MLREFLLASGLCVRSSRQHPHFESSPGLLEHQHARSPCCVVAGPQRWRGHHGPVVPTPCPETCGLSMPFLLYYKACRDESVPTCLIQTYELPALPRGSWREHLQAEARGEQRSAAAHQPPEMVAEQAPGHPPAELGRAGALLPCQHGVSL